MQRYYGNYLLEREVSGMRVAALEATVPADQVHEHTHQEGQLILVTRGLYRSSARDMPAISAGPVVLFNPPGTTHRDCFERVGGRFVSVSIEAALWDDQEGKTASSRIAHRLGIGAMARVYQLRAELVRWDFASGLEHEAGCYALMAEVSSSAACSGARPVWLERVRDRLRAGAPPTLRALALDADVHPVYLVRAFRRHFGCSPGAYLRQARLECAVGLLAQGASLVEAAHGSGFHDQSHFNRTLRESTRLTPTTLRALMRALD